MTACAGARDFFESSNSTALRGATRRILIAHSMNTQATVTSEADMKVLAIRGKTCLTVVEFEDEFLAEPLASAGLFAITGTSRCWQE
jgi:hypothetical protein